MKRRSHRKANKKKKYPDVWCYTDMHFKRKMSKQTDAQILLRDYKGHILFSVEPHKPTKTEMLAQKAGVTVGSNAWLDGDSIDALIELLREAKHVWLEHYRWMCRVAACKACSKIFGGMCEKHCRKGPKK